jgi:hypothetical protein
VLLFYHIELFSKTIPAIIFLILSVVRYKEIVPIGISKTTIYSRLFKGKLSLQISQCLIDILLIVLYFVNPYIDKTGNPKRQASTFIYEQRMYSLFLLFNVTAWLIGAKLMHYEYIRRLSEAYYAHWVYWGLMLINNVTFFMLNL